MTKILYNTCFGGFNLSDAAIAELARLKGLPTERTEWGLDTPGWSIWDLSRTDPVLIQVVNQMGEAADGPHSRLAIAYLPPGTKYYIHEYDGQETVRTPEDIEWSIA